MLVLFPLFSSQGLAAHGSCNSLRCCHCPLRHIKVEARLVLEAKSSSYSSWVTRIPLPSIVRVCRSSEPSLGAAWGACLSTHRSVPKKGDRQGERQLDGLAWIRSWPGSEEGPAMRRESNRTSRVSRGLMVLLPSDVAGVGWIPCPSPSAPPYKPGLIRGELTTLL